MVGILSGYKSQQGLERFALHTQSPFFDSYRRRGQLQSESLAEGFSEEVGQLEDAAPPDRQPVSGEVQDPLLGNGSGGKPRLRHRLNIASETGREHIHEAWVSTSWIVEMAAAGTRFGKLFQATHSLFTSL